MWWRHKRTAFVWALTVALLLLLAIEVFLSFFTKEDEERPWWEGESEGSEWFEDIRFYLALVIVFVGMALAYACCNTGDARSLKESERWYHCYWCAERGCCKHMDFDEDDYDEEGDGDGADGKRRCGACCC